MAKLTEEQKHENRVDRFEQNLKQYQIGKAKNMVAAEYQRLIKMQEADRDGVCTCVTCGSRYPFNSLKMNAGHFYSRRHASTLYRRENLHAQCAYCNNDGNGNASEYRRFMHANYSEETFHSLHVDHFKPKQWTRRELAEMKATYLDHQKIEKQRIENKEPSRYAFVYPCFEDSIPNF